MNAHRALTVCRRLGSSCLPCALAIAFLFALRAVFGFERWHAKSPFYCHPYKQKCVMLIEEEVRPRSVVELGCGLGEIIRRISAPNRYGIDIDVRVVRAARFIAGTRSGIEFRAGSFPEVTEVGPDLDLLIMVNWPHSLTPTELQTALDTLFAKVKIKWLLVDEIVEKNNHRCQHDYEAILHGRYAVHRRISDDVHVRNLVLLRQQFA